MPSGVKTKVKASEVCSQPYLQKNSPLKKKASYVYTVNKRPTVRGVAKNAVDHPNGGKGRSGLKQKKSPWGWFL